MRIDVITIFPGLFDAFLGESFLRIARGRGLLEVSVHDLRDWATGPHRRVDDSPYGGGPGMLMTPEPLVSAIEALAGGKGPGRSALVVLMTPQGRRLDQRGLEDLADVEHLVLVCGRYEGVDERAIELAVDQELSVGDYVLSGGEVPAMVVMEGVARLIPGVLGNPASAQSESYGGRSGDSVAGQGGGDLLEGPQYTRPPVFRGHPVPEVLRSGDHGAIARWRAERARVQTEQRRPDLLESAADERARERAGEEET